MDLSELGFIAQHHKAVLDRVSANTEIADMVYVSKADDTAGGDPKPLDLPYIMIFVDNGQYTSDLMAQASDKAYFNYTVHLVGETYEQINWLADQFYAQWKNWRPVVPGRRCFKMVQNFSTPDNTNDSLHPTLLYRVDEWGFFSMKGKAV